MPRALSLSNGLADSLVPRSGILILTPANHSWYPRWFFLLLKHNQLLNTTIHHTRLADLFFPHYRLIELKTSRLSLSYLLDVSGPCPINNHILETPNVPKI